MTIFLPNLAIAGYRSFGPIPQYLNRFAKVNVFIGRNNSGKSNILRFIHELASIASGSTAIKLSDLDRHRNNQPPVLIGIGERVQHGEEGDLRLNDNHRLLSRFSGIANSKLVSRTLGKLFWERSKDTSDSTCWSIYSLPERKFQKDDWARAMGIISDDELYRAWQAISGNSGGDRKISWEPELLSAVRLQLVEFRSHLIPAIRRIGEKGSSSEGLDGAGIIDRLAKLQNPPVLKQFDRLRFDRIRDFLRDVADSPNAEIEVPYDRDTIKVHMDGKVLPIESLGTGLHEVLIIASAATVLEDSVVCIEEPELHLNPILQKKLMRYLQSTTNNQYFITTHSAALMDTPEAEIYHVSLKNGSSHVVRATSDKARFSVCEDLGYRPSDLLQANCIVWVEGPSDRIYINWWLKSIGPELVDGIHYSVMFYGGRLLSHLSNAHESEEVEVDDFIRLRRLNQRGAIVIDSDRSEQNGKLNQTKERVQTEFELGPGHAWITAGREVENYLPAIQVRNAVLSVHPSAKPTDVYGPYDSVLEIKSASGKPRDTDKVKVARQIVTGREPDLSILDLKGQIEKLVAFIRASNPENSIAISSAVAPSTVGT